MAARCCLPRLGPAASCRRVAPKSARDLYVVGGPAPGRENAAAGRQVSAAGCATDGYQGDVIARYDMVSHDVAGDVVGSARSDRVSQAVEADVE